MFRLYFEEYKEKGVTMGILEVLTIIFVVLKLIGTISWSWFHVFIPAIISIILYLIILCIIVYKFLKTKW